MQILSNYCKFSKEVTENARKTLKCELDIPYGTTKGTKYDIYGTDLPKDSPIFIFIHGGYWQEGSKDVSAYAAPVFVNKGIKVITIGYDLCPNVKLRDIISQIKTAIAHILKSASSLKCRYDIINIYIIILLIYKLQICINWMDLYRNVWISGHSAGAHLASSILYDKLWLDEMTKHEYLYLLKGIVLISGIFNLEPLVNTSNNTALKLTKNEIDAYSFTTLNIKNNTSIQGLKVIVTNGECDSPVFINESRECAQKLITMVDNVQYILLRENIDHFDIVENLTNEEFILTKLILRNILYD
ncbi:kynurenine formamidase isoform X2 [Apis cerana]|nr:kynurenine formamidase isoform X2 [Apis cerana]XP_061932796.1 kynurenine formamidase isoform X2 [Apis cerana]XP_061932797.1 kynurenine formamidase isoform X2 [Apis cerana]XP_061932798.1 kynurenine formamidase isoform X2 [Apis cerana]XP_061932799.1 kynurenine formamidase isoform X2 [Apis cerana]XP_061932800.1 kynurenine formamidase isoform X2 [Apis cerana]